MLKRSMEFEIVPPRERLRIQSVWHVTSDRTMYPFACSRRWIGYNKKDVLCVFPRSRCRDFLCMSRPQGVASFARTYDDLT